MEQDSTSPKPKRQTGPKTDKSTLALIQFDYVNGSFKSIKELATRYGVHENTLFQRINRENWEELRLKKLKELEQRIGEKAQSIGETYLKNVFARAKKYEQIIDASQSQLAANDCGVPLMDCEAINDYTLAEQRIHEMAKSALRIPSTVSMDVTSKGQSLGESLVSAIQKLRSENTATVITMEQADALANCEIVKVNKNQAQ